MSDKIVTLAMFHDADRAEMAKIRLEAAGIRCTLGGDTTNAFLSGMGGAFGMVHLQVLDKDAKRAAAILDEFDEQFADQGPEPDVPDTAIEAGQPRPAPETIQADKSAVTETRDRPPRKNKRKVRDKDDDDRPLTWTADDLATRAWRAAVLGLFMCPPSLHLYSIWLLLRIAFMSEEPTARGMRRIWGALVLDLLVLGAVVLAVMQIRLG